MNSTILHEWFHYILLGFVQGLTEFLPVSSSGHLVLFSHFFKTAGDDVTYDLALHIATLIPVLWFYRRSLQLIIKNSLQSPFSITQNEGQRFLFLLVTAMIPTTIIGFTFKTQFESMFSSPTGVSFALLATALLLALSTFSKKNQFDILEMKYYHALLIGLFQGFAIIPGISRSGSTIAIAILLGIRKEKAASFSFLLSIPCILGAFIFKIPELHWTEISGMALLAGMMTASVSGYLALKWCIQWIEEQKFYYFSIYLIIVSISTLTYLWMH